APAEPVAEAAPVEAPVEPVAEAAPVEAPAEPVAEAAPVEPAAEEETPAKPAKKPRSRAKKKDVEAASADETTDTQEKDPT
ncbi:MAG TPA: hypothetical protein VK631_03120, partial [Solirubrobacteraceae bacterium]|nr:hypothetical protein [Solirubrobacteraceae bacterium]